MKANNNGDDGDENEDEDESGDEMDEGEICSNVKDAG